MKTKSIWVNEIIESLKVLGGKGTLNEIYDQIIKRRKINLEKYIDWKAQVRRNIYEHSSDAKDGVFKGKPGDSNDLFYTVEGKGSGIWGLRNYMVEKELPLRDDIIKIMDDYLIERTKPFKANPLVNFIKHKITNEYKKLSFINKKYKVIGSAGVGNWAAVPWIAIMNTEITTSTQRGFYLVYLFSEDMKKVYLTLAQGVTETSKSEMEEINNEIRSILPLNTRFKYEPKIKLGKGNLAKQYEDSVAVYIEYSKDNIPSNEVLIKDLYEMLDLYEKYIAYRKDKGPVINEDTNQVTTNIVENISKKEVIEHIYNFIKNRGFYYSSANIVNLFLSLKTKPFVIISGISGTGKTKIVQLFAESIGATEENGQFKLIPVRPDWSDSSDLLGYKDIKGDFIKGPFTKMVENALQNPDLPHFVLLDEMNLARVEYYFSDVLSVMESRKMDEDGNYTSTPLITYEDENGLEKTLTLPGNLYVIGTVNMDETTHTFSKKVLDRANTIEFNEIDIMNFNTFENIEQEVELIRVSNEVLQSRYIFLKDVFKDHESLIKEVSSKINKINEYLEPIYAQVGYRVRDEICFYMIHNAEAGMLLTENEAMDFCIMQKILPRISGTENVIRPVLVNLEEELEQFPKCKAKIVEMKKRLDNNGFTSFWIA
ncbi:DUF3578 domain-containing protein [Ureibacillus sp. FSL K6-0786]|jgi:MoxR-like ATPase|uniref:McrB family protein n=2 Tax=unclassified Ureibacillus TaxID=2638520 RepID=UPI0030D9AB67